jgi:hypothetical protein
VKKGYELQGGTTELVAGNTIEQSDHTQIYADDILLQRLKTKYNDLETRKDVVIIPRARLDEWYSAVQQVMLERGLTPPE